MITFESAFSIIQKAIPKWAVLAGITECPDCWAYVYRDRKTGGIPCYTMCFAIKKQDGERFTFNPWKIPEEYEKQSRLVSLSELEKLMNPKDFALMKKYRERDEKEEKEEQELEERTRLLREGEDYDEEEP